MKMISVAIKTLLLAIVYGLTASVVSAVLDLEFYKVIASFAMWLSCYLLIEKKDKAVKE